MIYCFTGSYICKSCWIIEKEWTQFFNSASKRVWISKISKDNAYWFCFTVMVWCYFVFCGIFDCISARPNDF